MTDESIPSGALKVAVLLNEARVEGDARYTIRTSAVAFTKGALFALNLARRDLASPSPATGALQWLPIESAPKNGTWLLVAGPDYTGAKRMVCRWMGDWEWESADDGFGAYINPTHWMPLPAPPAASQVEPEDKNG